MSRLRRPWAIVIALQACALAALAVLAAWLGRDELKLYETRPESEVAAPTRLEARDGLPSVTVSAAGQRASGIEVVAVAAYRLRREAAWYGSVVATQPLEEARARVLAAEKEAAVILPQLRRAEEEYRRVQSLFRDDRSASERAMQAAEADFRAESARLAAARERVDAARAALAAQWGDKLAQRVLAGGHKAAHPLLTGEEALVRLSVGAGGAGDPPAEVDVSALGDERPAHRATLLSPAPQADPAAGGLTWFYRAPGAGLRGGMRVIARAADTSGGTAGVLVPGSAVVWHGGKSWVYVQSPQTRFTRREIVARDSVGDAWFVATALAPGEKVVTSGAQLLLSEEFRFQIKNENTD